MMARSRGKGTLAALHGLLRAPGVSDPRHYQRRVLYLAIVHVALLLVAALGFVLLIWRGELFVTLAQRSNVEALTIAFVLVLFAYFVFVTLPGACGALRLAWFHTRRRIARDAGRIEARRLRALGERGDGASAAFDKVVELEGAPHQPFEIELRDEVGSLGRLRFDGVHVQQLDTFRSGSNTLLGYVERKLRELADADINVVLWHSTEEEKLQQYHAMVDAMRALGRKLDTPTWPALVLSTATRDALARELSAVCGALRDEMFLPDWEFSAEHKLPIIPEPLGIISLSRSEQRVDPLSSMLTALVVITIVVGLICFFLARPPWVPGT